MRERWSNTNVALHWLAATLIAVTATGSRPESPIRERDAR